MGVNIKARLKVLNAFYIKRNQNYFLKFSLVNNVKGWQIFEKFLINRR